VNKKLAEKLTAYSGIASSFFLMQQADAQIIYTNPLDIVIHHQLGSYGSVDLNNDGIVDVVIETTGQETGSKSVHVDAYSNYVRASRTCEPFRGFYSWFVTPLKEGQNVAAGSFASGNSFLMLWLEFPRSCKNVWAKLKGQDRYLGIKLRSTGDPFKYYFGWIRLSMTNKNIIIRDWAYNSVLGVPIKAGQKDEPETRLLQSKSLNVEIENIGRDIYFKKNEGDQPLSVIIYNLMGEPVQKSQFEESSFTMHLNTLPQGEYIVVVMTGEQSTTEKILLN
jgi:hypothetical protein